MGHKQYEALTILLKIKLSQLAYLFLSGVLLSLASITTSAVHARALQSFVNVRLTLDEAGSDASTIAAALGRSEVAILPTR